MAGQTDQRPPEAGATPVPDLIERYRMRRDAWIAQADELARLRDEVRGSAEREAMEIVTAARRDVRQILMDARRELLVLSAQVQAALGEATVKTDPATLLHKAGIAPGDQLHRPSLTGGAAQDPGFAPETAVDEILNEVHGDMAALAEDARTIPLQAVPPLRASAPVPSVPSTPVALTPATTAQPPAPAPAPPAATPAPLAARPAPAPATTVPQPVTPMAPAARRVFTDAPAHESPSLSEAASRALLSSPFPSEAVPVPSGRSFRTFVALFVAIGILVALASTWWLRDRGVGSGDEVNAAEIKTSQPADTPTAPEPAGPREIAAAPAPEAKGAGLGTGLPTRVATKSGNLSLVAEAVREVWVRTTIDGRADQGRTLSAGQVINLSAERNISFRVGDAGAVVVSVNRGEKRPLGRDGQVVTRQFVAEGAPERTPSAPVAPPREAPASAPAALPPAVGVPPAQVPAPPASVPVAAAPSTLSNAVATAPVNTAGAPPAPVARPETTSASAGTISPATAVVAAARQWLDAYHRQDRSAMAALSTDNLLLADERRADERLPSGLGDVKRTLDRVSVQIAADTAVLTAVMTEQADSAPAPRVSPVSQVWVLAGNGQWKVRQARFVSEARLNQVFR